MSARDREHEEPLPRYGLAGSFVGERCLEDDTWDLCEIGHRPAGSQEKLSVTVIRRTTARPARGVPRVAISPELARESVTDALVVPLWRVGDEEVFTVIKRVANDDRAWRAREITFDGRRASGYEREYRGRWVVYHLTSTLIVSVAAPVALRPGVVELRRLKDGEFNMNRSSS